MASDYKCDWCNSLGAQSFRNTKGGNNLVSQEKFCCLKCKTEYESKYGINWIKQKKTNSGCIFLLAVMTFGVIFFVANSDTGSSGSRSNSGYEKNESDNSNRSVTENSGNPTAGSPDTWMVIVGSFTDESEAYRARDSYSDKLSGMEVFSTNAFTKLKKDLYVVCAGKGLSKDDAFSLSEKLKEIGLSSYIKDAGPLQ